uniref:Uncharacterized protein LOC111117934 n=1 Tax=Crassostrea virginica TaxID=6565 RepID=A0A8B8CCL0_CRAVI|nr:uncharacterized protein LOC111117934 [Crassostrea virginica]
MNTNARILCAFALNVHVIMVLGANVSNGSKICVGEELLKSCTRACGTAQCSFNSYCGDDVRCLYCSDEKCSSPPVGCELFCEMRQQEITKTPVTYDIGEKRIVDYDTLFVLCWVLGGVNLVLMVWLTCRKRLLKFFSSVKQDKKEDIEIAGRIMNCSSEAEHQTSALLVSGGTQQSNREYNRGDTRRE